MFENPECGQCGGPGVPLGQLGSLMHFRCRNCGMMFSETLDEDQDKDREEDREEEDD